MTHELTSIAAPGERITVVLGGNYVTSRPAVGKYEWVPPLHTASPAGVIRQVWTLKLEVERAKADATVTA